MLTISSHRAANSVSPAWIQAHGHAQIFGWIGSFILGIGFYSIPKLRRMGSFALTPVWCAWGLWTSGVALRWLGSVYPWHWRVLVPLSSVCELTAFLVFFRIVSGHHAEDSGKTTLDEWVFVVIAGALGLLLTLLVNVGLAFYLAFQSTSPEVPANFDQRFLVLETWGCLVPFVWGFSAKWLPVFLGLRPVRGRILLPAIALNSGGVLLALAGAILPATVLILTGLVTAITALRLFEPSERPAKVKGVHVSFPFFVRLAYLWALIAAFLSLWAALSRDSSGIWGASRHALTVGFLATMVFAIGQRVLPAFSGMRLLFSTKLMFCSLMLLAVGCLLRVSSEVLAYQGMVRAAWSWLPTSAICEMAAVTVF
ncbi:MAG: NnrS family protein, partial [Acidobacteriia bacterium]|nr:NnrS family protein [Terriglobia bacterium]